MKEMGEKQSDQLLGLEPESSARGISHQGRRRGGDWEFCTTGQTVREENLALDI